VCLQSSLQDYAIEVMATRVKSIVDGREGPFVTNNSRLEFPGGFSDAVSTLVGCLGRLALDSSNLSVKSISSAVRLPSWIMGEFASDLYGILDDVDVVLNPVTARLVDVARDETQTPKFGERDKIGVEEGLAISTNVSVMNVTAELLAAEALLREAEQIDGTSGTLPDKKEAEETSTAYEHVEGPPSDLPDEVECVKVSGAEATSTMAVDSPSEVYELIQRRQSEAHPAAQTDVIDTPGRFILLAGLREVTGTSHSKRKNSSGSDSSFNLFHNRRASMVDDVEVAGRRTTRSFLFSNRKQSEFRLPLDDIMRYPGSIAPGSNSKSRNCFSIAVIENDQFSFYSYNSSQAYLENLSAQLMQLGSFILLSNYLVAWNVIRMQYLDRVVPIRSNPLPPWEVTSVRHMSTNSPPPSSEPDVMPSTEKQCALYGL
jgi:hypothetical protein